MCLSNNTESQASFERKVHKCLSYLLDLSRVYVDVMRNGNCLDKSLYLPDLVTTELDQMFRLMCRTFSTLSNSRKISPLHFAPARMDLY